MLRTRLRRLESQLAPRPVTTEQPIKRVFGVVTEQRIRRAMDAIAAAKSSMQVQPKIQLH